MMIRYSNEVEKNYRKGKISKKIMEQFHNAFLSLELTKDFSMFDIKQLKSNSDESRIYFRLRKGKYRAIFFVEQNMFVIISIAKREEVYKKWQ